MGYISTGMGDSFGALLMSLMALRLTLSDRNPFRPCFKQVTFDHFSEGGNGGHIAYNNNNNNNILFQTYYI